MPTLGSEFKREKVQLSDSALEVHVNIEMWVSKVPCNARQCASDESMLASITKKKHSSKVGIPAVPSSVHPSKHVQNYHDVLFREQVIDSKVYGGTFAPILNFALMPDTMEESYAKVKAQRKHRNKSPRRCHHHLDASSVSMVFLNVVDSHLN
jgi:hypothetical protein